MLGQPELSSWGEVVRWLGGQGVGDGEAVGDGGGGVVLRLCGCAYAGRRDALGGSAQCVNQSFRTNYSVQRAVMRLCYHWGVRSNEGLVKYQGRCISDWSRNYCAINDEIW